ncbi:hypothetical protein C5S53_17510 [Methanophagales archaeon]|nr:hypothetical protein C5S53_17510 [Methanophagales archaeon]
MAAFEALSAIALLGSWQVVAYLVGSRKAIKKPFLSKKSFFFKRKTLYRR